jgi:hypothetical protein
MRLAALSILACVSALAACASKDTSSALLADDASVEDAELLPAEDGNMSACTAVGGTCIPYTQPCPPLQQNPALCEDTVMVCCLPEGGARLPPPTGDDGGGGGGSDAGMDAPVVVPEAGPDTGGTMMEAGTTMDAGGD